jgi:hypothetical protein
VLQRDPEPEPPAPAPGRVHGVQWLRPAVVPERVRAPLCDLWRRRRCPACG